MAIETDDGKIRSLSPGRLRVASPRAYGRRNTVAGLNRRELCLLPEFQDLVETTAPAARRSGRPRADDAAAGGGGGALQLLAIAVRRDRRRQSLGRAIAHRPVANDLEPLRDVENA